MGCVGDYAAVLKTGVSVLSASLYVIWLVGYLVIDLIGGVRGRLGVVIVIRTSRLRLP